MKLMTISGVDKHLPTPQAMMMMMQQQLSKTCADDFSSSLLITNNASLTSQCARTCDH
jgi:hypothetical protein